MSDFGFGFKINLIDEIVTFDGGLSVKILEMLDRHQEDTDEFEQVRFIVFEMPPDGMMVMIDLDDSELVSTDSLN